MTTQNNQEVNAAFFDLVETLKKAKDVIFGVYIHRSVENLTPELYESVVNDLDRHISQLSEPCVLPGDSNAQKKTS